MAERLVGAEKSIEPLLAKMRREADKPGSESVGGTAGVPLSGREPETSNPSPMSANNTRPEERADNVVDLFRQLALMFDMRRDQVYLDGG
ncbi:hypothetical protein DFP73DRAFT_600596 [Morchella snyderi]|nr:hypothetical protein DFP73DRAFT_600596 [Morchella snyderi]